MSDLTSPGRAPGIRRAWVTGGLLAAAAGVYFIRLTSPFTHPHENVAACYLNWTRNYLVSGYAASGLAPVRSVDPVRAPGPIPREELYSHRPPTVSLVSSLFVRALGPTEGAMRLVGLLASLATVAVFLAFAKRLMGEPWGALAAALFALCPLFAFFGVAIAHQTFGILGGLGILLAYLRWRENPSPRRLWSMAGVALGASWLDWPSLYGAAAAGLLHLLAAKDRRKIALVAPSAAAAGLTLFLLYLHALDPSGGVPLRDLLATGDQHRQGAHLADYVRAVGREALRGFTVPILLLAALGTVLLRPRARVEDAAVAVACLLGADVLLFPSLTAGHLFMITPWAPFLALAATRGLRFFWERGRWARSAAVLLLAGCLAQGTLYLARAHRGGRFPYYAEASRSLGQALRRHTGPHETILVRGYVDPHLVAYYSFRRVGLVATQDGPLRRLDHTPRVEPLDEAALIDLLSRPGHGFSWFVTTSLRTAQPHLGSLSNLPVADPDAFARDRYAFESDREPSRLVKSLEGRALRSERDGFLFFDLRERR
jgi:hypothetical protein